MGGGGLRGALSREPICPGPAFPYSRLLACRGFIGVTAMVLPTLASCME